MKKALEVSGGGGGGYQIFMDKLCCFNSQVRKYYTLLAVFNLFIFFVSCLVLFFWGCANLPPFRDGSILHSCCFEAPSPSGRV